jgi:hypothetical protein
MKEQELRSLAVCSSCGRKIGESGLPLFWRVTIERFGLELRELERQQGLALMLGGNGLLARVMGPDADLARPLMDPVTLSICEPCGTSSTMVAALAELSPVKQNMELLG